MKKILNDWDEIFDLDVMVSCDILPSSEMFFKYQGLMGYKEQSLRKLVTKLQTSLEDCQAIEIGITCNLEKMGCQILDEHDNLIAVERMTLEYATRINADIDSEDFGSHTMNKFSSHKSLANHI